MNCPCGNTQNYSQCCEPFHLGKAPAPTAEALMRSRYSAFAKQQLEYLRDTLHPQNVHDYDAEASKEWAESSEFTQLEILKSEESGNKGIVEFKAFFKADGEDYVHHEVSTFRKQGGKWYFKSGKVQNDQEEGEE